MKKIVVVPYCSQSQSVELIPKVGIEVASQKKGVAGEKTSVDFKNQVFLASPD